ncbi:Arc family DNA-binding protein [Acidithiobacillus thiooxidans]|uniref:Arc family DNA-binding protein n=1 Tax=Acidithiobacillus thiooxidans TaxID=930 RepID=UPI001C07260C|nr:Arc family DNA-binding protein [Acidithiobacillus thiooxidans]MBU2750194.1 Arc family DNA-binding protein [Acidithiobacillus thiooxidans]
MREISTYTLRLPKSLKDALVDVAKRNGTSVNQFIAIAVAEKISAMETERFFTEKGKGADMSAFRAILRRPGGESPRAGDEWQEH